MPEFDIDGLFEQFRGDGFLGTPPGPDAVRQVHRHRRRVHAAAGGAVAALLIAAPVGFATADRGDVGPEPSDSPSPSAPQTPTTTPTTPTQGPTQGPTQEPSQPPSTESTPVEPTQIPAEAMLQPSDLPARFGPGVSAPNEGDWTLYFLWSTCGTGGPSPGPELDTRHRAFVGDRDENLNERVVRYEDVEAAEAWFDGARAAVRDCDRQSERRTGFAGDESLLIRTEVEGYVSLHVLVRQGALVAEVWQKHLTDERAAQNLGERAAQRLCAGTLAC